jgi:hypothetical protein
LAAVLLVVVLIGVPLLIVHGGRAFGQTTTRHVTSRGRYADAKRAIAGWGYLTRLAPDEALRLARVAVPDNPPSGIRVGMTRQDHADASTIVIGTELQFHYQCRLGIDATPEATGDGCPQPADRTLA